VKPSLRRVSHKRKRSGAVSAARADGEKKENDGRLTQTLVRPCMALQTVADDDANSIWKTVRDLLPPFTSAHVKTADTRPMASRDTDVFSKTVGSAIFGEFNEPPLDFLV
jgi:hypothetical protein